MKMLLVLLLVIVGCKSFQKVICDGIYDNVSEKCVYIIVEKMPVFIDDCDFQCFIATNLKSPDNLDPIINRANALFVIDKKGNVVGARIKNKDETNINAFEAEVLRIIRSTQGKWLPGEHFGEKRSVLMRLPLHVNVNR